MNLNILRKLTKDNIIYYRKTNYEIDKSVINLIYYGDDNQLYLSHILLDNVQYEIFEKSNNKEEIILKSIENGKCYETENITNLPNITEYLKSFGILDKVRDIKINKIIN